MERKAIFFDIDGTLVDCLNGLTSLSDKTKDIFYKLKKEGHSLFIASGRPYCYLLKELREFDFDGYILNDGAHILFSHEEFMSHPIQTTHLQPLIQQVIDDDLTMIAYSQKYAYFYHDDGSLLDYCHSFMIDDEFIRHVDDLHDIKEPIYKLHIQTKDQKSYQNLIVDNNHFCVSYDDEHYLREIYSRHYSKATALLEVLDELGIEQKNSYFFGDGLNDIEMMKTVGYAIAMDNACEEVKQHANAICKSVSQDGVTDFIVNSGIFFE